MQLDPHTVVYNIRLKGHLDERWQRWFEDVKITRLPDGSTEISGMMDQAALHGVLNRIRDLGIELISVNPVLKKEN